MTGVAPRRDSSAEGPSRRPDRGVITVVRGGRCPSRRSGARQGLQFRTGDHRGGRLRRHVQANGVDEDRRSFGGVSAVSRQQGTGFLHLLAEHEGRFDRRTMNRALAALPATGARAA
jgi:hypothetical protein